MALDRAGKMADAADLGVTLLRAAADPALCPADLVETMTGMALVHLISVKRMNPTPWGDGAPVDEPRCPGCSGTGPRVSNAFPSVRVCDKCHGLFTAGPVPRWVALKFVALDHPMVANSDNPQYFDFDILGDGVKLQAAARVHGWFDRVSKRVTQWG